MRRSRRSGRAARRRRSRACPTARRSPGTGPTSPICASNRDPGCDGGHPRVGVRGLRRRRDRALPRRAEGVLAGRARAPRGGRQGLGREGLAYLVHDESGETALRSRSSSPRTSSAYRAGSRVDGAVRRRRAEPVARVLGLLRLHLGRELGLVETSATSSFGSTTSRSSSSTRRRGAGRSCITRSRAARGSRGAHRDDPGDALSQRYDLIWNGWELGVGLDPDPRPDLQQRVFRALGLTEEEANEKFGCSSRRSQMGAPPHGGFALGLDRFVALVPASRTSARSSRFRRCRAGADPLTGARPGPADQLDELGIGVVEPYARARSPSRGQRARCRPRAVQPRDDERIRIARSCSPPSRGPRSDYRDRGIPLGVPLCEAAEAAPPARPAPAPRRQRGAGGCPEALSRQTSSMRVLGQRLVVLAAVALLGAVVALASSSVAGERGCAGLTSAPAPAGWNTAFAGSRGPAATRSGRRAAGARRVRSASRIRSRAARRSSAQAATRRC